MGGRLWVGMNGCWISLGGRRSGNFEEGKDGIDNRHSVKIVHSTAEEYAAKVGIQTIKDMTTDSK